MTARPALALLGALLVLAGSFACSTAEAAPRRIVIVRHGEKHTPLTLCSIGRERAQALAAQYLSPTSPMSLLRADPPAAILAMTLHTVETARPIARAWDMRLIAPPIGYVPIRNNRYFNAKLNTVNQRVARDLLTNPRWQGKTVLMVWEHFHIASAALEAEFAGEPITLRQLFHLDKVRGVAGGVPMTWPDSNYNFFWILTYDRPEDTVPSRFEVVRQYFAEPFANLPSNDWNAPEPLPPGSGCT
ncbi:histidine phosphatase family protein [Starkeya koreensis]|uniref:Histidine phosphatase family protein n=1 Tax=Ancylobacter koreensis TaxID=266121 RepID=A0ABT0DM48_9HYPH|nr:histidine phosphatase family protein [Ancylobacter koreensis]MCK0208340.1 histidine phosphatase family protein [Ancylobacter koreensis]